MLDVTRQGTAPFDTARLDRLMDEAGIDVLLATSKHNVQYLLGGHRSFFFDNMDAIGISRYLPVFVYAEGRAGQSRLFRPPHGELTRPSSSRSGSPRRNTKSSGTIDVMQKAADYLRRSAQAEARRHRACVPAGRLRRRAAQGIPRQRVQGRAVRARAPARPQDAGGTRKAAARLRPRHRFHARGVREPRRRRHQGGNGRSAAPRRDLARAHFRLLPDRRRHRASTALLRSSAGRRATCSRSIPAATITAISATSHAWAIAGEPDAELVDLLGRDRIDPAGGAASRSAPASTAAKSMRRPKPCCTNRSCTITSTFSLTAWASSATKRRA